MADNKLFSAASTSVLSAPSGATGAIVRSTVEGDPDLGDLVPVFIEELARRVQLMREQFAAERWNEMQRTAHQLKGSAGSYGFACLTAAAARLEDIVEHRQSVASIGAALDEFVALCRRIRGPGGETVAVE